ncbi:MAG: MurR/RpiR family transcriptional regulator [Thermoleophilia bacterium]
MAARRKKPATNGSLLRALQDDFENFSKARQAIARYLIDHLAEAPVLTTQGLARHTGTTSSTVVRFAQHLGFTGFPQMMNAAWEESRLTAGGPGGGIEGQLVFPVDDDFSGRAVRIDVKILEETMKRNRANEFLETVELLESAETIFVAGLFEAAMVATYLSYYFTIMGLPVVTVTGNSEEQVARLAGLGEKSVLIAIGFKTAHQFLLRLIKTAKERGALSVGISENTVSEVSKLAERNLYCYLDSSSFAPSLVGAFGIADALVSALYVREKRTYDAHISRLHSLPLSSDWL